MWVVTGEQAGGQAKGGWDRDGEMKFLNASCLLPSVINSSLFPLHTSSLQLYLPLLAQQMKCLHIT